jgi:hypothetical protein
MGLDIGLRLSQQKKSTKATGFVIRPLAREAVAVNVDKVAFAMFLGFDPLANVPSTNIRRP